MRKNDGTLSPRKRQILKAIVEAYISTGEPVGSKYLTQNQQIGFSSATIRNEMADLAEMGYLDQPYTSAGRIPSPKGYKFYVNELMNQYSITNGELDELNRLKREKQAELDRLLEDAGKMVSLLTNYTSLTVLPRPHDAVIRRFDGVYLDERNFILVMTLGGSGEVKTKNIHLSFPISKVVLRHIITLFNYYVAGQKMDDVTLPIIMKMEEQMDSYAMLVNPLIKTVYDVINAMGEGEIHFEGMNKLLQYPEFSDVEQMRRMFDFFERKNDIFSLVEHADTENGVNVYIGRQDDVEAMDNSALVLKTLTDRDGRVLGAIGVVGPSRMDYSRVVALVESLMGNVQQILEQSAREKNNEMKSHRLLGNGGIQDDGTS